MDVTRTIGGDIVLAEQRTARHVVRAVGERLQREHGVRGAAVAQVDLHGVAVPGSVLVLGRDEVDREPPDHASVGQRRPDRERRRHQGLGVRGVGGKPAAQVALSVRPAEHLIVGREHLDLAERAAAQLHARAGHPAPDDPLLDDAARGVEHREEPVGRHPRLLGSQREH
jgi:hypothetical protein